MMKTSPKNNKRELAKVLENEFFGENAFEPEIDQINCELKLIEQKKSSGTGMKKFHSSNQEI